MVFFECLNEMLFELKIFPACKPFTVNIQEYKSKILNDTFVIIVN